MWKFARRFLLARRIMSNRKWKGIYGSIPCFISANVRKAVQEGRADFTPVLLSEFPLLFKNNILPVDVALDPCLTTG